MTREEAIRNLRVLSTVAHPILAEACTVGIAALREQDSNANQHVSNTPNALGGWISVEERLPGTERILITDGELVKEGYRRPDGVWKYGREEYLLWSQLSIYPVTHWMPLPEAPKEEAT